MRTALYIFLCLAIFACTREDSRQSADSAKSQPTSVVHPETGVELEVSHKEIADVSYTVHPIPSEVRARRFAQPGSSNFEDELEGQKQISVYRIRISRKQASIWEHPMVLAMNPDQQQQYFGLKFKKYISLKAQDSILPASLYIMDQTLGIKPYIDIVVGFDLEEDLETTRIISINDQLFGTGKVNIST